MTPVPGLSLIVHILLVLFGSAGASLEYAKRPVIRSKGIYGRRTFSVFVVFLTSIVVLTSAGTLVLKSMGKNSNVQVIGRFLEGVPMWSPDPNMRVLASGIDRSDRAVPEFHEVMDPVIEKHVSILNSGQSDSGFVRFLYITSFEKFP